MFISVLESRISYPCALVSGFSHRHSSILLLSTSAGFRHTTLTPVALCAVCSSLVLRTASLAHGIFYTKFNGLIWVPPSYLLFGSPPSPSSLPYPCWTCTRAFPLGQHVKLLRFRGVVALDVSLTESVSWPSSSLPCSHNVSSRTRHRQQASNLQLCSFSRRVGLAWLCFVQGERSCHPCPMRVWILVCMISWCSRLELSWVHNYLFIYFTAASLQPPCYSSIF